MSQIQVPKGWNCNKFQNLTKSFDGLRVPLNKSQRSHIKGIYPYYGASEQIDSINDYKFDGRFLLIAEDGENLNSQKKPIAFMVNGKFWVNNHAHVVQTNDELDVDFLCYYINSLNIMSYAKKQSTRPKLNKSVLDSIPVFYPDKQTQNKIVQKLDYILGQLEEKKKEILYRINRFDSKKILNSYQNHLLNLAFSGKLTGEELTFSKEHQIQIPKGWKLKRLGDVFEPKNGKWLPNQSDGLINYIGLENIESNTGRLADYQPTETSLIKSSKTRFTNEDILYGKLRPYLNKVLLPDFDGVCSTDILVLHPKDVIDKKYLGYFLLSSFVLGHVSKKTFGTKMPRTKIQELEKINVVFPEDKKIQKRIVQKLDDKFNEMKKYEQQITSIEAKLQHTKKSLDLLTSSVLNSAFTGKLVN